MSTRLGRLRPAAAGVPAQLRTSLAPYWPLLLIAALLPAHFRGLVEIFAGSLLSNVIAVSLLAVAALTVFALLPDRSRFLWLIAAMVVAGLASAALTLVLGRSELVAYYIVPFGAIAGTAMAMMAVSQPVTRAQLMSRGTHTIEMYLVIYALLSIGLQLLETITGEPLLAGTRMHGGEVIRSAAFTGAKQVHGIQTAMFAIFFAARAMAVPSGRGRAWRLALAAVLGVASVVSFTRAGVFILLIFGALMGILRPRLGFTLLAGALALVVLSWVLAPAYLERVVSIFDLASVENATRLIRWQETFQRILQTPLILSDRFGVGSQATRPFWPMYGGGHGENFVWSFMVNIGIPGALAYCALLLIAAGRLGRTMIAFMAAILVEALTYMTLESSAVLGSLLLITIAWPVEQPPEANDFGLAQSPQEDAGPLPP